MNGSAQVRTTQTWPVHTFPGLQSALPQHSKQPCPAQQCPPEAHSALEPHTPRVHVSVVQELPSLQWALVQHCWQAPPQSCAVAGAQAQAPPLHTAPGLHAVLQAPQWIGLVRISTSQSLRSASQSAKPDSHSGCPPAQIWCSPAALPHAPQFLGSVSVFTHDLPHKVRTPHPARQLDPSHTGRAVEHDVEHEPQCAGSVTDVSQPGTSSQSR
jgi:hypothetical protein